MNFYYFGDGYATGHLWPEWPQIIQALYPEHNHVHCSAVGCGNEFIATAVANTYSKDPSGFYFVQWAVPNRLDKLLQDQTWDAVIDSDPVYHFNRVNINDQQWWLSSASKQPQVTEYHKIYCQSQQSLLRTFVWIYLTGKLLKDRSVFSSTPDFNFSPLQKQNLLEFNWAWQHPWIGMLSYSEQAKFASVRQQQVQPAPPVHFAWVAEVLLPRLIYKPNAARLTKLESLINTQPWQAYDPDRDEIWQNIVKALDTN